jgi:hypothetical protein
LGIAIFALVPYNYFTSKVAKLQFEPASPPPTSVMVNAAKTAPPSHLQI